MYQIEKAKRQDTFLPSWEERAEGAGRSRGRGQVPAQPQAGHRIEEGWRVRIWAAEDEKENILIGL